MCVAILGIDDAPKVAIIFIGTFFQQVLVIANTVRKTNKVILLHEDAKTGGIAGELAAIINEEAFDDLDGPIVRVTAPDTPVPYSPPLEEAFLPNAEKVLEKARWLYRY